MVLFSKFRAQTVTPFFKRNIRFPNEGMPLDPRPHLEKFSAEPHGAHIVGITNFMVFVVVPLVSAVFWYQEYQHNIKHPHRPRWPKMDFMNQGVNPWPFRDGKHSCFHHPYYNFTPNGYETDKDGNPLPPGVYAEE